MKTDAEVKLTVLGARGSMAVSGKEHILFGGATSCYMVQAGDDCVFLDAGSGLLAAPVSFPRPPLILLSHLHLDHLLGLGMYKRLLMKGELTTICLPAASDEDARKLLNAVFSPPYWPLELEQYRGDVVIRQANTPMRHGVFAIDSIPGNHPCGCRVYKLSCAEKSLVYASDFEHDEQSLAVLAEFAQGTDLLLYDGQYDEEEYFQKKGFGHSTAGQGIRLMERCGAKRMLLIHHDPFATDEQLLHRQELIQEKNVSFARAGEVLTL